MKKNHQSPDGQISLESLPFFWFEILKELSIKTAPHMTPLKSLD